MKMVNRQNDIVLFTRIKNRLENVMTIELYVKSDKQTRHQKQSMVKLGNTQHHQKRQQNDGQ
jgi:hypothetical protein